MEVPNNLQKAHVIPERSKELFQHEIRVRSYARLVVVNED